jgi:hypothetical protein
MAAANAWVLAQHVKALEARQMHRRLEPKLINLSAVKNPLAQDGTENHSTG